MHGLWSTTDIKIPVLICGDFCMSILYLCLHLDHTRNGVNATQERFIPRGSRHLWRGPQSENPKIQNPEFKIRQSLSCNCFLDADPPALRIASFSQIKK